MFVLFAVPSGILIFGDLFYLEVLSFGGGSFDRMHISFCRYYEVPIKTKTRTWCAMGVKPIQRVIEHRDVSSSSD